MVTKTKQLYSRVAITPSTTPLKRYLLHCPKCGENEVYLPAEMPESPFCRECEEDVDLDTLAEFINEWMDYLGDRETLLQQDPKEEAKE